MDVIGEPIGRMGENIGRAELGEASKLIDCLVASRLSNTSGERGGLVILIGVESKLEFDGKDQSSS